MAIRNCLLHSNPVRKNGSPQADDLNNCWRGTAGIDMETQISAKKLNLALEEMKEISRLEYLLYTGKGRLVAATRRPEGEDLSEAIVQFAKSPAESQMIQDWIFLRVELEGLTEYVLLCSRSGSSDSAYVIARMAASQIRNLCISARDPSDQTNFLRQLFNGEVAADRIDEKLHYLKLREGEYALFVIQFAGDKDSVVLETLKNLFVVRNMDYLVEMNASRAVLLKHRAGIDGDDFGQYARVIVDNVQAEAMANVWIGYGVHADTFRYMDVLYRNACTALRVGRVFYGETHVFCYERLGLGRLIHELPPDLCELFLKEVLGENADMDYDDEMLSTINQLFDNNLNISETARQLYIHRNTLVYRLERIEKRLGLDIRSFEDAMLFKLAMMVRTHLQALQDEKSPLTRDKVE